MRELLDQGAACLTGGGKLQSDGSILLDDKAFLTSPMMEINTSYVYKYTYTFDKEADNGFLIGIERYDKDLTSSSNSSCVYQVSYSGTSPNLVNVRNSGFITFKNDNNGNPVKYVRMRILNSWNTGGISSKDNAVAVIKQLSLIEINTQSESLNNLCFGKSGVVNTSMVQENFERMLKVNQYNMIEPYCLIEY